MKRRSRIVLAVLGLLLLVLAGWLWLEPVVLPEDRSGPKPEAAVAEQEVPDAIEDPRSEPSADSIGFATRVAQPVIPDSDPAAYFLRVIDDAGNPLRGARVKSNEHWTRIGGATSDERGIAAVPITADAEHGEFLQQAADARHGLDVEAAGFGPAILPIEPGHEDPSTPQEARLTLGAGLEVVVRSETGDGLAGIHVRLSAAAQALTRKPTADLPPTMSFTSTRWTDRVTGERKVRSGLSRDLEWTKTTDAAGRALFEDLPGNVPLEELVYKDRELLWSHPCTIRLQAGDHRVVELTFGELSDVTGTLLDPFDAPVADKWIYLDWAKDDAVGKYLFGPLSWIDRAKTDATGRFTFRGIAPGVYFAGPMAAGDVSRNAIAPRAERIDVPQSRAKGSWILRTHRGLFIRGTVVGPNGAPLEGARIRARSKAGFGLIVSNSDSEGRFVLGPLFPEVFLVDATQGALSLRKELRVEASSGTEDLLLRLE